MLAACLAVACSLAAIELDARLENVLSTADGSDAQPKDYKDPPTPGGLVCSGNGLTYFALKNSLTEEHGHNLDNECSTLAEMPESWTDKNKSSFTDSLSFADNYYMHFQRQKVTNIKKAHGLSAEQTRARRIPIPAGHPHCVPGGHIRCIPGPCRIWEYDYQSKHDKPHPGNGNQLHMVGEAKCGPLFGVQARNMADDTLVPQTPADETVKFFPTILTEQAEFDAAIDLNSPAEFRVPVPKNTSFNGNPYSYYTDGLAHKYGVPTSQSVLTPNTCSQKFRPPMTIPTNRSRWTKGADTLSLGLFDVDDAGSIYGGDPNYKKFVTTNQPDQEYVGAIPQLLANLNNPEKIAASGQRIEEYQKDLQSDSADTCDLSQCAWLPTIDGETTAQNSRHQDLQDVETCFFAELRQLYVDAVDKYCTRSPDPDTRVCPKEGERGHYARETRDAMSNPGGVLPDYCYGRNDAKPNKETPHNGVFCHDFPYTMSFATPGFKSTECCIHNGVTKKDRNRQRDEYSWCDVFIQTAKNQGYNSLQSPGSTLCTHVYDNAVHTTDDDAESHSYDLRREPIPIAEYYNGTGTRLDATQLGLTPCTAYQANAMKSLDQVGNLDTSNTCFRSGEGNYDPDFTYISKNKQYQSYINDRKAFLNTEEADRVGEPYFRYLTDNYFAWPWGGQCVYLTNAAIDKNDFHNVGGFYSLHIDYASKMLTGNNKDTITPSSVKRKLPRFACGPRTAATDLFANSGFFKSKSKHFEQCFSERSSHKVKTKGTNNNKAYAGLLECLMDTVMPRHRYDTDSNDHIVLFVLSILTHIQPDYPKGEYRKTNKKDGVLGGGTNCGDDEAKVYRCQKSSKETGFWNDDADGITDDNRLFAIPNRTPLNSNQGSESEFAFDAKQFKYYIWKEYPFTQTTTLKNQPLKWAITDLSEYRTESPLHLNASFLNAADNSESHACNCGNSPIIYAFNGIPWRFLTEKFKHPGGYTKDQDKSKIESNELSTWIIEAGYAWQDTVGNINGAMSIGLYLPSNPKYSYNFEIVERDFLTPARKGAEGSLAEKQELLNRYYLGDQVPEPDVLVNELQFAAPAAQKKRLDTPIAVVTHNLPNASATIQQAYRGNGEKFSVSKFTYEKGSCMRFPYGQVSRMEMNKGDQEHYFRSPTRQEGDSMDHYRIGEESLMGYCENVADNPESSIQYPYCFNDPNGLGAGDRTTFCSSETTRFVVVGEAINERQFEQVCNTKAKYCLVIPGEPLFPTIADVLSYKHHDTLKGFTLMVTPFNFSVARFLLGPGRFKYEVKGGYGPNENTLKDLGDTNTNTYGIKALTPPQFSVLSGDHAEGATVHDVAIAITGIKRIIDSTFQENTTPRLSAWRILQTEMPNPAGITEDYIYPPIHQTNIKIIHNDITIRSALVNGTLKFDRTPTQRRAGQTCNRFLVAAPGFVLGKTDVDQTHCDASNQQIDRAAILYGGANVSNSKIKGLSVVGAETPIIFAGDDNILFAHNPTVTADNVDITYSSTDPTTQQYIVAAARTKNTKTTPITLRLDAPNGGEGAEGAIHKAIIQPLAPGTCHITLVHQNATLVVIDASEYTGIFGDNIMRAEYPLLALPHHVNYILFVALVVANAFLLVGALVAWCKFRNEPLIPPQETDAAIVFTTPFGSAIAINKKTGRYWNAYQLRRRLVKNTFGEQLFGVPDTLKHHLLKSSFKVD